MGRDDWFRNDEWSAETAARFWERLRRSRSSFHIAQYLRIQAVTLEEAGLSEPALELVDHMIAHYPEKSELSGAHQVRASALVALGRPAEAVDAFRDALRAEAAFPNLRTNVAFDFAIFAVRQRRTDLYDEVEEILLDVVESSPFLFPVQRFEVLIVGAILEEERGNLTKARGLAQSALEAAGVASSGISRHPGIGLVPKSYADLVQVAADIAGVQ